MKKLLLLSAAAWAFAAVSAQADCSIKIDKLERKLAAAKEFGNFYQVRGLERALANVRANCGYWGSEARRWRDGEYSGRYDGRDGWRDEGYDRWGSSARMDGYRALKRDLDALEDRYEAREDEIEDALDALDDAKHSMSKAEYEAKKRELKAKKRAIKNEYKAKKREMKERFYR